MITLIGIRNELKVGDLKIIPVRGLPIITQCNLVHRKGMQLNPLTKALIEYINTNKEDIVQEHFSWVE